MEKASVTVNKLIQEGRLGTCSSAGAASMGLKRVSGMHGGV